MCLYPRTNHILIADRDIVVFKSFDRVNSTCLASPYMSTKWNIGETKTVGSFGDDDNPRRRFQKKLPKYETIQIGRGLHAYQLKSTALRIGYGDVVARCIIPKGTPYIIGSYGDIVSLALKVVKIVR